VACMLVPCLVFFEKTVYRVVVAFLIFSSLICMRHFLCKNINGYDMYVVVFHFGVNINFSNVSDDGHTCRHSVFTCISSSVKRLLSFAHFLTGLFVSYC